MGPEQKIADDLPEANAGSEHARILALDLGGRRIGIAISGPFGNTAHGLPTLERRNRREDLNFLKSLARKRGVSLILLGNPVNMNGSEGPQSAKSHKFALQLQRHLNLPVRLWDERLTSKEAEGRLRQSGARPERNPQAVDQMAAVLLLEDYLESQRALGGSPEETSL